MKRYEALRIIRSYLTSVDGSSKYCALCADDDAEACLKELESAGMLPPPVDIEGYSAEIDEVLVSDAQGHVYLTRKDLFQWED